MPPRDDAPFLPARLEELAKRAEETSRTVFSPFLAPPEAQAALTAARRQGVSVVLFGGYPMAERQVAGFSPPGQPFGAFPVAALAIAWPRQAAPTHRDLLGSVLGLGIRRQSLGDIALLKDRAYLFILEGMAAHVADVWRQAGRASLEVSLAREWPELAAAEGAQVRDTVPSLRLDAVLAGGLGVSRARAAEWIRAGSVKLRHMQALHVDARVEPGDMISIRGVGRVQLTEVGAVNRKGRLSITLTRYGF